MKKTIGKVICAASLTIASAAALANPPSIVGHWKSVGLENYGQVYATREFQMTSRDWLVVYRAYADAQGKAPLFTIRNKGSYAIGEASDKVSRAYEGIFPSFARTITAESEAGIKMFGDMGRVLTKGQAKLLVNSGCGFIPGVMQVMGEYDLVSVQNGQLFLGDREGDLSKKRPEKLTQYPLKRIR